MWDTYAYLRNAVLDLQTEFDEQYEFTRSPWGTDIRVYPQGELTTADVPMHLCIIRNQGDPHEWFVIQDIPDEYHGEQAVILAGGRTAGAALRSHLELVSSEENETEVD